MKPSPRKASRNLNEIATKSLKDSRLDLAQQTKQSPKSNDVVFVAEDKQIKRSNSGKIVCDRG
ncbi:28065_t:CDS:2, partial [Gigaspora margarita]